MTLNTIIGFIAPLALLLIGVMLRFSRNESWNTYRKYWIFFVLLGLLLFALKLYKYLM